MFTLPAAFAANRCPPPPPPPLPLPPSRHNHHRPPLVELTIVHCQRKRQQQHHHQRTNGSTNVKIFTSPVDLDLFYLSTVFEVCDVGRGNLVISKLLALKNLGPFLGSTVGFTNFF
jgi:hypothetical protein